MIVTDPAPLAGELRLAVHRLTRRLRAERPLDGLTLTQLSALATIWREGPLTAGDLATREGVKPPSITRVLTSLEAEGMITRSADPSDGRQVLVSATRVGAARIEADIRARDAWLAQQIQALNARDRALLHRASEVLDRLGGQ
jgi:DNA-binding MarR family transcriptional regulator